MSSKNSIVYAENNNKLYSIYVILNIFLVYNFYIRYYNFKNISDSCFLMSKKV